MLGGFVSGLLASFELADPARTIDQTVEMILRAVGLEAEEAGQIASLPLAELN